MHCWLSIFSEISISIKKKVPNPLWLPFKTQTVGCFFSDIPLFYLHISSQQRLSHEASCWVGRDSSACGTAVQLGGDGWRDGESWRFRETEALFTKRLRNTSKTKTLFSRICLFTPKKRQQHFWPFPCYSPVLLWAPSRLSPRAQTAIRCHLIAGETSPERPPQAHIV